MKRLILICTLAAIATGAFAQAKNVKKVRNYIENSLTPISFDLTNAKPEMIPEYRELLEPAKTDPESKDLPDTWLYSLRLKIYDMVQMINEYAANGNQFKDMKAFFQNQYDIVQYAENFERCMNTPGPKGKLPYKEDEMKLHHANIQQVVKSPRTNLVVGASQFYETDPVFTQQLLDLYYETLDNPLFAELDLRHTDTDLPLANFIYATVLKETGANEEKRLELLQQSLDSENGALALQDLITYYKEKGDKAEMNKYLKIGTEKFPKQLIFAINLIQNQMLDHQYVEAIQSCDQTIARIEADEELQGSENFGMPYYFKAVALYNQEKFAEAYDAFLKAYEVTPTFENLSGAGTSAAQLGQEMAKKTGIGKPNEWYTKAIAHFEQCKEDYPNESDLWGYQLYALYNNTGNTAKAAQYKKYSK